MKHLENDIMDTELQRLHRLFDEASVLIAPIMMPIINTPKVPPITGAATDGRILRDMVASAKDDVQRVTTRPDIRSQAYGLSGTKNELLRDCFVNMQAALTSLENVVHDYLDKLIDSFAANAPTTQSEINELLRHGHIATRGNVDDVILYKLRGYTNHNPAAEYSQMIKHEMSILGGHENDKVLTAVDGYGLIQKSIHVGINGVTGREAIIGGLSDTKNMIVIHHTTGGEYFRGVSPKKGDVMKAITTDFVERMRPIITMNVVADGDHILHVPRKGALTSVYVTFDYETFFFMTGGFDENLVPYHRAIGYYSAMTGVPHEDTPTASHATYNDRANEIFAERWYRHDLVVLATAFKPGAGLSDALKSQIKDGFLKRILTTDAKAIIPREVIYEAIHRVLPEGSRESRISSYLAADRLVTVFSREYAAEVEKVEWTNHQEVTMMGVVAAVIKKCDKLNVWSIDFRSPKDIY